MKNYIFLRRTDAAHPILTKIWFFIAYNVPAVYDVFAAAMKKLRSSFSSRKMWVEAGVGMSAANDLASRNPVAP